MQAADEIVARARLICGEDHVVSTPAVLAVYRSDGQRRGGPLPLAAALPGSAAEVAGLVAACRATETPYGVRGAGTSVTGGAQPRAGTLLIVLSRMRRVIELSRAGDQITVEPGVPAAALPQIRDRRWLSGEPAVGTVGGRIAEHAGSADLIALELVDPQGRQVRLEANAPGYDLVGAFRGSRGRAGIAVAITLRAVREQ